jgi:transposase
MQITTIGLDLAKNVFQVHGVDAEGRVVAHAMRAVLVGHCHRNQPDT